MKHLFSLSRPRFWLYTLGPFALGCLAAAPVVSTWNFWLIGLGALYFTFPANLLIYGVNDIFDYQTDKLNQKKQTYEKLVQPKEHRALIQAIILSNLPFLLAACIFVRPLAQGCLAAFLFFGIFYSAPAIRAKTKPFLDASFNILYACAGFTAYALLGGSNYDPSIIIAALCWCAAMHAFSAVPDISADTKAGLKTIATVLGVRGTLICCLILYAVAAVLSYPALQSEATLLGAAYVTLMLTALWITRAKAHHKHRLSAEQRVFSLYTQFPLLNALAGMSLFFSLLGPVIR